MQYALKKGEVFSFRSTAGSQVILVADGGLWITCTGDPHDYLLVSGDRFRVEAHQDITVEALRDASFTLSVAQAGDPFCYTVRLSAQL
ncbi:MAG: DUF2917 domain-containing protein [Desulfuromonadales bacterium]|nr:DUF2917 domain-containing protein [Desulfuromonadales bacterium]